MKLIIKDNLSVFIKVDGWRWLMQSTLTELHNITFGKNVFQQTLLDDDAIGSCRITIASIIKAEVDILQNQLPELMIRQVDHGRRDDPRNGELLLRVRMKADPQIDFNIDDQFSWKFSVNVNILEWGEKK